MKVLETMYKAVLLYEYELPSDPNQLARIKEFNALLDMFNDNPKKALRYYLDNFETVRHVFSYFAYFVWDPNTPEGLQFEGSCDAHEYHLTEMFGDRDTIPNDDTKYAYALLQVLDCHNALDEDVIDIVKTVLGVTK